MNKDSPNRRRRRSRRDPLVALLGTAALAAVVVSTLTVPKISSFVSSKRNYFMNGSLNSAVIEGEIISFDDYPGDIETVASYSRALRTENPYAEQRLLKTDDGVYLTFMDVWGLYSSEGTQVKITWKDKPVDANDIVSSKDYPMTSEGLQRIMDRAPGDASYINRANSYAYDTVGIIDVSPNPKPLGERNYPRTFKGIVELVSDE